MSWEGSDRKQRLPKNWQALRKQVLVRDKRMCQIVSIETGYICGLEANEVDHIIHGDNHELSNLQAICTWHHRRKSSQEGNASKIKYAPRNRKPEKHPGSL